MYLFIFACAGSLLPCKLFSRCGELGLFSCCRAWASHGGILSCGRAQVLVLAGFSSFGTWAQELQPPGSGAQAQ